MQRRFSTNFAIFSMFLDFLWVDTALFAAEKLRGPLSVLPLVSEIASTQVPALLYVVFPLLWVSILFILAVYDGQKHLRSWDDFSSLTLGSLLAIVALAGILYLSYRGVSRFLFLMAVSLAYFSMLAWRAVGRLIFREQGLHTQMRKVLILGRGDIGMRIAEQIRQHPQLGLTCVGFLDDDPQKYSPEGPVLGSLDDARTQVQRLGVDDLMITLPLSAAQRLTDVVSTLNDLPVRIWVAPNYFSLALHHAEINELGGIPLLDLRAPALNEHQRMVKRAFDLTLTTLILPFALPLMALTALAVRLDQPGPVLYRTRRAGENGREFWMLKFRTMTPGADQILTQMQQRDAAGRVTYKRADDPRVTRVGRFLRRTSLDELPQLFNVLKGEMSLIGPRPELPELVNTYTPWQRKRFAVPQGMTGWWQINGRSDKPMHLHTDEDLYYIQHYSIWLDIQILFRTIWTVLSRKGAY